MKKILLSLVVILAVFLSGAAGKASAADVYKADKVHSTIGFTISHLMVSKVTGAFNDYVGTIQLDPKDVANSSCDLTIKVASIDTKNEARDNHLKNSDFFAADKFPEIMFKSKKVVLKSGADYLVTGDLTMRGVTKEVELPVTLSGPVTSPMDGSQVLGIESHFVINRQDYGVSWNKALDNGGVVVGNDVHVSVLFEAHK